MKVIQAYQVHTGSYMLFGIKKFDSYCVAWCLIWWFAGLEKVWSYVIIDTECPYWDQMPFNNIIQTHSILGFLEW